MLSQIQRRLSSFSSPHVRTGVLIGATGSLLIGIIMYARAENSNVANTDFLKLLTRWMLGNVLACAAIGKTVDVLYEKQLLHSKNIKLVKLIFQKALRSNKACESIPIIRNTVESKQIPTFCDFWILEKNTLLISKDFGFKAEANLILKKYAAKTCPEVAITSVEAWRGKRESPWVRDFIATKNHTMAYVFNDRVPYQTWNEYNVSDYDKKIITLNRHVSPYIYTNHCKPKYIDLNDFAFQPTNIAVEGGNAFHCVNAHNQPYLIIGEFGLTSQTKLDQPPLDTKDETGSRSVSKYLAIENKDTQEYIRQRKINKQILKAQAGATQVAIVPNAFFIHLDLEMCVLPNGVVLLHSHNESLRLIHSFKQEICQTLTTFKNHLTFEKLHDKVKEHISITENLFEKTAAKLRKRGFIVIPVCGFLTFSNDLKGIIAAGFNGIPAVLPNGEILYTLPKNPKWYEKYFKMILEQAGVKVVHPIKSQTLNYFASFGGFMRCQTNTLPTEMLWLKRD